MKTFNPPHEVTDFSKFESMTQTLKDGGNLPAVVVAGENALTGSHRLAAWIACDLDAEYISITDAEFNSAASHIGIDPMYDVVEDYSALCEALYHIVNDDDVKIALKDQF